MRVAASSQLLANNKRGNEKPKPASPDLEEFKFDLRKRLDRNGPRDAEEGFRHFRQVAKSIFGDAAFASNKEGGLKLNLSRAQLKDLATHPGKIRKHLEQLQAAGEFPKDNKRWSVNEAARMFSAAAKSALGNVSFTVVAYNDDFTDKKTDLNRLKKTDVILAQEVKRTHVRKEMAKDEYGVHQDRSSDAKAGSAVVWDKDRVKAEGRGLKLGVHPNGQKMLTRYITYTDVKIDGVKVRMASVHRPPKRDSELWPAFDRNLRAFVKSSKLPLIIGMDSNTRTHAGLERATGLKWYGKPGDIDGFLVSPQIKVENVHEGKDMRSKGHQPVYARFTIKK